MPDLAAFPDVHPVLIALFADLVLDPVDVGMVIPADLQTRLFPADATPARWVIRVHRLGGADDRFTDRPRVSVDVMAATYVTAVDIAEQVRQRLITKPRATSAGVIDRTVTESGPAEFPYEDQDVRLIRAIYRVSLRRRVPA